MLKTEVMSEKHESLGYEQQLNLAAVLYIPKINGCTFTEIHANILEVLGSMLRYHQSEIQGNVKRTDKSRS